jgi:hypothetical protein
MLNVAQYLLKIQIISDGILILVQGKEGKGISVRGYGGP